MSVKGLPQYIYSRWSASRHLQVMDTHFVAEGNKRQKVTYLTAKLNHFFSFRLAVSVMMERWGTQLTGHEEE